MTNSISTEKILLAVFVSDMYKAQDDAIAIQERLINIFHEADKEIPDELMDFADSCYKNLEDHNGKYDYSCPPFVNF